MTLFHFSTNFATPFLFSGEVSYMLGLAFFFYYIGYLIRHRGQLAAISRWFLCLAGLILFATHLLPFCIALLVTGIFACFELSWALIRKLVFAFSPSVALTLWYALARFFSEPLVSQGLWQFWTAARFAGIVVAVYTPFHKFLPWLTICSRAVQGRGDRKSGLGVIALVWLACGTAIWWTAGVSSQPWLPPRSAYSALSRPASRFADVVSPGERFAYPGTMACHLPPAGQS